MLKKASMEHNYSAGDVVAYEGLMGTYPHKILKATYLPDGRKVFVVEIGAIIDNDFKPEARDGRNKLAVLTEADIRDSYPDLWTPDVFVPKRGDIVKDQWDNIYLMETDNKVWNLAAGTWGSPAYWAGEGRIFRKYVTRGGTSWRDIIKISAA